jgi:hypothetical protein
MWTSVVCGDGDGDGSCGTSFHIAGLFTWVCLSHCAWFSELSSSSRARSRVLLVSELSNCFVALPIALGYRLWQPRDLSAFRAYVVVVALFATAVFLAAGVFLSSRRKFPHPLDDSSASQRLVNGNSSPSAGLSSQSNTTTSLARARHSVASELELASVSVVSPGEQTSIVVGSAGTEVAVSPGLCDFMRQIVRHRNFWAFVFVNFLQVYQLSFQVRAKCGRAIERGVIRHTGVT